MKILLEAKTSDAEDPMAMPAYFGYDENCKQIVNLVGKEYGRIDILVNNAVEQQHMTNSIEEITEQLLERFFRTNIFSVLLGQACSEAHERRELQEWESTSAVLHSGSRSSLDAITIRFHAC